MTRGKFFINKYHEIFYKWLSKKDVIWSKFPEEKIVEAFSCNIFVVYFESIDLITAEFLHDSLREHPSYLGALEVDDSFEVHQVLYNASLLPFARIMNKNLYLSYYYEEGGKDHFLRKRIKKLGFSKVAFECLN